MRQGRGAILCLLLSLIGLVLCGYLGFLHIGLLRGELLGGIACGSTGTVFNCHAVTAGRYGSLVGLPLWGWGFIGYLGIFSLAVLALIEVEWAPSALNLITALALAFVALDAALGVIMVTQIRYVCPLCVVTYVVNLGLLLVGKRSLAQPWTQVISQVGPSLARLIPSRRRPFAWLFWYTLLLGASGTVGVHAATTFVSQGAPGAIRKQLTEFVTRETRVYPEAAGDPTIGSSLAPIEVVEFSDFFCPACQRASKLNAILLANHRRDVRFVFKHFPLDTSCNTAISRGVHPGACLVAAASECAHQQGQFWALHDKIFEAGAAYKPAMLEQEVAGLGIDVERFRACVASGAGKEAVVRDIAEAKKVGVQSTPTYVINGVKFPGLLSPSVFEELLAVLSAASR